MNTFDFEPSTAYFSGLRGTVKVLTIALVLGASSTTLAEEPASPSRFVVVPHGAVVYTAPKKSADRVKVGFDDAGGGALVFRYVATRGDWIEVAPDGLDQSRHCYATPDEFGALGVNLWVRRDQLARVTVRPVEQTHEDGTRLALTEGVVVAKDKAGIVRAWIGLADPEVRLESDDLGEVYIDVSPNYTRRSTRQSLGKTQGLEVGGRRVAIGSYVPVQPSREAAGARLVTAPCGVMTASTVAIDKRETKERVTTSGASVIPRAGASGAWQVAADKPVYWADGKRAGTTTSVLRFYGFRLQPEAKGKNRCLERRLVEENDPLTVCFRKRDLEGRSSTGLGTVGGGDFRTGGYGIKSSKKAPER